MKKGQVKTYAGATTTFWSYCCRRCLYDEYVPPKTLLFHFRKHPQELESTYGIEGHIWASIVTHRVPASTGIIFDMTLYGRQKLYSLIPIHKIVVLDTSIITNCFLFLSNFLFLFCALIAVEIPQTEGIKGFT